MSLSAHRRDGTLKRPKLAGQHLPGYQHPAKSRDTPPPPAILVRIPNPPHKGKGGRGDRVYKMLISTALQSSPTQNSHNGNDDRHINTTNHPSPRHPPTTRTLLPPKTHPKPPNFTPKPHPNTPAHHKTSPNPTTTASFTPQQPWKHPADQKSCDIANAKSEPQPLFISRFT